jgi:hypothetical protein
MQTRLEQGNDPGQNQGTKAMLELAIQHKLKILQETMKLQFMLSTFNLNPTSYYKLSEVPFKEGDNVEFCSSAKRLLIDTDDETHKVLYIKITEDSGHYIAGIDYLDGSYDCAWLKPVWRCKKL